MKLHDSSKVGLIFIVAFFFASLSHSFAQIQDITPPTLTDFSFTPSTIDTSAGPVVVTVSWSATDDLSGVQSIQGRFLSPSGEQTVFFADNSPPPGTNVSGTINVTFPQFSEVGTWTVLFVALRDEVSNFREYSTTELAQLGFPTELEVVGQEEDTTPPMITVSATPKTLSPPNGRKVTVTNQWC